MRAFTSVTLVGSAGSACALFLSGHMAFCAAVDSEIFPESPLLSGFVPLRPQPLVWSSIT